MTPDDPRVRQVLTRSMTVRVATLSAGGVPHLTPLRFIYDGQAIYALTRATSPAVGHLRQQPGVVLLLDAERPSGPVLRLEAQAAVRGEPRLLGWWERRAATKYFLRPGGIWDMLIHWRNLPTWVRSRRSATPADTALLQFVPQTAEFIPSPAGEDRSKNREGTVGGEDAIASRGRSTVKFFLLVYALTVPFWVLGAVTGGQLSPDLSVGALMVVCPAAAASILAYRENGTAGVTKLLRRSLDYQRISAKAWYAPIVLLLPGTYAVAYGLMRLLGLPVPTPQFPVLAALVVFLGLFVGALGEELGWSGYAIDPLQARWNALRAAVVLGLVSAIWHLPLLLQVGRSPGWIAWWSLGAVAVRVLLTWIYNNAGKSVFAAALCHATMNLSTLGVFVNFGASGFPYDAQRIASLIIAFVAAVVTVAWGPRTLAGRRRPGRIGRADRLVALTLHGGVAR